MPPPPVIVQKKRGMGCCGCGCFILVVLALLFIALVAGMSYFGMGKLNKLTSTTAEDIPAFDGGADAAQAAQKKCDDFLDAVHQHQPATLQLSADEINTLIEHNPGYLNSGSHIFVSMAGDQAEIHDSLPFSALKLGILDDRFLNNDTAFALHFDPEAKQLNFILRTLRIGEDTVPESYLPMFQNTVSQSLNQQFRANPLGKDILDNAKSIEIQDGQLMIETQ